MSLNLPHLTSDSILRPHPATAKKAHPMGGGLPVAQDSLHLRGGENRENPEPKKGWIGKLTDGGRWKGGFRNFFQSLRSVKWWLKQGAVACGITLATCWLPGSQLVTIPAWLSMAGALKHGGAFVKGFQHPEETLQKKKARKQDDASDKRQWSKGQKLHAGALGAWTFARDSIKNHWKGHLAASSAITLATCWLPGSQLILIPSYFCMVSVYNAVKGLFRGYKKPGEFLS